MNATMKRACLAVVATAMLLSACGGGGTATGGSKGSVAVSGVNEFPITEEPTTLRIFMEKPTNVENVETNDFTKWYEEKTNVKVQWDLISGDTRQAINLKLASDDYSDVWLGFSFAVSEQSAYYDQGAFIDISDLVDKHGYYIKEMFADDPKIEKALRHTDNLLLGLPNLIQDFSAQASNKMWIYKPWMDKLGLSIPTTTDEFYNVLKAFKEKDPNGNGQADEVPLAARNNRGGQIGLDMFLMNCFTDWGKYGLVNDNGKATFCAITEEAKEGIRYMRKLYQEGLIHPDSFVMYRARVTALAENEVPILGAATGMWTTQFTAAGSSNRMNEYVAVPPLKSATGQPRTQGSRGNYSLTFYSITSSCENPEVAIKWIDWFYSQEGYLKARAEAGTRQANEGELGLDGQQAVLAIDKIEGASAFDSVQNEKWPFIPGYISRTDSIKTAYHTDDATRQKNAYAAYEMYKPF
ncbi:MAG: extracellular solute-binding protein, partial [Clostridia bacterium]